MRRSRLAVLVALTCLYPAMSWAENRNIQRGDAAVYHPTRFTGRPMANGVPFNPNHSVAAHLTLPLGTVARVTNLRNGATTTVVISDRGPYTRGRILDLSPRAARDIGIHGGVTPVEIVPIPRQVASR
jgi:rare lipoprotein A